MPRSAAGSFGRRVHLAVEQRNDRAEPGRQEFLSGLAASLALAGCAGSGATTLPTEPPVPGRSDRRRIVIVGAGAAGVTCALRLHQAGIASSVFEANSRVGGRTWTLRDFFADGQYAEHGGQFIASSHRRVRLLAAELGLRLVNLNAGYPPHAADTYYIAGKRYTHDEAVRDYGRYVYGPLSKAVKSAGYSTTFYQHTRAGAALDRMSVDEWLDRNVPAGTHSKIGQLLRLACLDEYGGEPHVQSALNLLYLFAGMRDGRLNLSGTGENDKYTIEGGNDRLVERIISELPRGSVTLGAALEALARDADGSYVCTFAAAGVTKTIRADVVVLSIPFTVLRLVDTRKAGFSARKRRAIAELDLGSNAKVQLQFRSPFWFKEHYSGAVYADETFQSSWDASVGQQGRAAMLACFPGGAQGTRYTGEVHGAAPQATAQRYLQSLEPSLPGALNAFNGLAYQDFWVGDPLTRGAYSFYKAGQYTTLCGEERIAEGNVHFCGEQTSIKWQGYINGAVESGERAAKEIMQDLGVSRRIAS
ncbi:MAG: NAD(P)/FAD-dependent oxidoreductase [Candidatus Cybelea sp.]